MKDRIIRYLYDFSEGRSEDLAQEILANLKQEGRALTAEDLKNKSREILSLILHQYSQFSIGTIDAFFQRIIRSFTRETGLLGNFRLEVDNDAVLEEVVNRLLDELTENAELRGWVLDFSLERLQEGKDWDIRRALLDFSNEIFREDFKAIEEGVLKATEEKEFFKEFRQRLQKEVKVFENTVYGQVKQLLNDFRQHDLTVSDFKYGQSGSVYSYLLSFEKEIRLPGSRVRDAMVESSAWPAPKSLQGKLIRSMAEQRWMAQLNLLVEYIEKNGELYFSAEHALRNLYAFGLLSDISRTIKKYLAENNLMLLSDAPKFLRGFSPMPPAIPPRSRVKPLISGARSKMSSTNSSFPVMFSLLATVAKNISSRRMTSGASCLRGRRAEAPRFHAGSPGPCSSPSSADFTIS